MQVRKLKGFHETQHLHVLTPGMLRHAAFHQAAQRGELLGQFPALERCCLIQRIDLLHDQRQVCDSGTNTRLAVWRCLRGTFMSSIAFSEATGERVAADVLTSYRKDTNVSNEEFANTVKALINSQAPTGSTSFSTLWELPCRLPCQMRLAAFLRVK